MTTRDVACCISRLAQAMQTWQVLEGNAFALPQIIAVFNEDNAP